MLLRLVLSMFLCGLCLATAAPATAQIADVSRMTCGAFLGLKASDAERLTAWLHGYFAGAAQRTAIDGRQFEAAASGLRSLCDRDKALLLLGAEARGVFLNNPASQ